MKTVRVLAALIGILLLFGLTGCGYPSTPGAVVQEAFAAANKGDFKQADKYVASGELQALNSFGGSGTFWDAETRNRMVDQVKVVSTQQPNDTHTTVHALVYYQPGSQPNAGAVTEHLFSSDDSKNPRSLVAHLIKENGDWKITYPDNS